MKICYICTDTDIPILGAEGCSIHIRDLTDALVELGHDVTIMSTNVGDDDGVWPHADVVAVSPSELDRLRLEALTDEPVVANNNLSRDLRSLLISKMVVEDVQRHLVDDLPDIIYERYSLFGWTGLELGRRLNVPLVLEVNAPLCLEQNGYDQFTLPGLASRMEGELFRSADAIIVVSRWLKEWIVSMGVAAERVHIVPNGVASDLFTDSMPASDARQSFGLGDTRVIGYVGSFQPWHDVIGLVKAFKEVRDIADDVRLMLVGYGPTSGEVKSYLRREGLADYVVQTGNLRHAEVPRAISAMDIAVLPYQKMNDFYFSPLKLFEYMAAGRTTIAAAIGQIEEIIEHGETGWLYSPGDVTALSHGLTTLLADASLRNRIGSAARARVLDTYTWHSIAERIIALADELLTSNQLTTSIGA
jgi:glycosyltransferase involved in cell wall biosynthesis